MRELLDQECAAVAGGNQLAGAEAPDPSADLAACEEAVTSTAIVAGAGIGAAVGSVAGGVGAGAGAIAGGSAGHLVATVVAPPLCRNAYRNRFGSGDGGGSPAAATGQIVHQFGEVTPYGRHQLMVAPQEEI